MMVSGVFASHLLHSRVFSMPPLHYSVLNLFESPRGRLAQISRPLRGSPDAWITEWLWIERRHVMTLQALEGCVDLVFEEGRLHLHSGNNTAELRWSDGRIDTLLRVDCSELSPPTRSILELHLS